MSLNVNHCQNGKRGRGFLSLNVICQKNVFTRQNLFLRWVAKNIFLPMGHVGRAPRGPLPEDSRFPDFAVSPTLPHFPSLFRISGIFCNFSPLKTLWGAFFCRPLSRRSLPDSRPGSGPPGPTFRLCNCYLTRSGKKGHGSIQKCDPRPTSIRSSEPLAPGGEVPRARGRRVPFCLYFWPRGQPHTRGDRAGFPRSRNPYNYF